MSDHGSFSVTRTLHRSATGLNNADACRGPRGRLWSPRADDVAGRRVRHEVHVTLIDNSEAFELIDTPAVAEEARC